MAALTVLLAPESCCAPASPADTIPLGLCPQTPSAQASFVTYLANPLSTYRVISAKIFQDGAIEPPTVPSTSGSSILHSNLDGSGKPPEAQGVPGSLSFQLFLVCFSLEHNRTAFWDLNPHPNLQLCTAPKAPLLGPAPWTLVSFSARY